ncbi:MAG: DUF3445 domain-containing protein [Oricola sp.]
MTELPHGFSIGLSPLADRGHWLAPDDWLDFSLGEKDRLIAERPGRVFMAQDDTDAVQREVADLLRGHLTSAYPGTYRADGDRVEIAGTGRKVDFSEPGEPVLQTAARLVADDLVIMRKRDDGWTLVAASLCFPTRWVLSEKFGRPITSIHAPVPGFSAGTRNAVLIERIFDNLQPNQTVQRSNWSVHAKGDLHQSEPHGTQLDVSEPERIARLFLRREYQTLTRLPESGDILFTIRVHANPLVGMESNAEKRAELAGRLRELDADELAYKGLAEARDRLVEYLTSITPP